MLRNSLKSVRRTPSTPSSSSLSFSAAFTGCSTSPSASTSQIPLRRSNAVECSSVASSLGRSQSRSFSISLRRLAEDESRCVPLEKIRNIAVIAHVDHGKTTLVDQLLRQSGTLKRLSAQEEVMMSGTGIGQSKESNTDSGYVTRAMDHNDLERERGITILAKSTSVWYKEHLINIVDTPGHADFGGEVERIMGMVDGVALVVDATEGPMTQTRFVLDKALQQGLRPLVVMNKADRPSSRPAQVDSDLFDLFASLNASDEQMEYPLLYASAKQGWAQTTPPKPPSADNDNTNSSPAPENADNTGMTPLFDLIIDHIPPPKLDRNKPFSMLTVQIEADQYVGYLALGKIESGTIKLGQTLVAIGPDGKKCGEGKVKKLFKREGLERVELEEAGAGEIVSIAGIVGGGVNATLCAEKGWEDGPKPLPSLPLDPPTLSMVIGPNDSPGAGKEGTKLTSLDIKERLLKESLTDVALQLLPGPSSESTEVRGRGVLHLGILLETLRREGYEICLGAPKAVFKVVDGVRMEPVESCSIFLPEEYAGTVVNKLTMRKGELTNMETIDGGNVKIEMDVPARGLMGYMAGEFKNDVHGQGTLNHIFKSYEPWKGDLDTGRKGAITSMASGDASAYAIAGLLKRGTFFITDGDKVYPGMVIGECTTEHDMAVNPTGKKQLTNMRAAGSDDKVQVIPAKIMSLEEMIAYMADDEVIEVTPKAFRLRKANLGVKGKK